MLVVTGGGQLEGAQRRNTIFTWVLRGIGTLGMWFGLSMVFAPITRVLDILPVLGTIGSWGIGLVTGLISLLLSLLTIGLAWVFYRPLLGGTIIALVAEADDCARAIAKGDTVFVARGTRTRLIRE